VQSGVSRNRNRWSRVNVNSKGLEGTEKGELLVSW